MTALLSTLTFICLIQASSGQKNLMENLTHRDVYLSRFSEGFFCFDIALYSLIYIGSHNLASPWQAVHNQHKNIVSVQNQNKLLKRGGQLTCMQFYSSVSLLSHQMNNMTVKQLFLQKDGITDSDTVIDVFFVKEKSDNWWTVSLSFRQHRERHRDYQREPIIKSDKLTETNAPIGTWK